jgi:hypothetical protein
VTYLSTCIRRRAAFLADHGPPADVGGHRPGYVLSIVGKVERLALRGEVSLVEQALELVRSYNGQHRQPAISDRHTLPFQVVGSIANGRGNGIDVILKTASGKYVFVEVKAAARYVSDGAGFNEFQRRFNENGRVAEGTSKPRWGGSSIPTTPGQVSSST